MDSCFDKSHGEAAGNENGDEPVQPAMSGDDDGREVEAIMIPSQEWLA